MKRVTLWLLAFALLVLMAGALSACGSTSGTAASTAANPGAAATTTTSTSPGSGSGGVGAGAAGFRVAKGDNSVPEFGSEASTSERRRATTALVAFLRARAKGEWSRVCHDLPMAMSRHLVGLAKSPQAKAGGCGPIAAALSANGGATAHPVSLMSAGLAALRVGGKNAFALFYGPGKAKYVMPMVHEGGVWKMTQLAPLSYPPVYSGAGDVTP